MGKQGEIFFNEKSVHITFVFVLLTSILQEPESICEWWTAFAREFFDHEAQLTVSMNMDDAPKKYSYYITIK